MILQIFRGQINILPALIWFLSLVFTITIHEFAHAWSAVKLGDPTAKNQGRLTLNPLKHLDLLGTLMLLLFNFGWGKPTPINPNNFEEAQRDSALSSLAGPLINIILAAVLGIVFRLTNSALLLLPILLNINVAIFNLLPIHPLDGEKILHWIVGYPLNYQLRQFQKQYGMYILVLLLIPLGGSPLLTRILTPMVQTLFSLFTGQSWWM